MTRWSLFLQTLSLLHHFPGTLLITTIAQRGIENNYDEEILDPYSTKTMRSDGTLLSRGFENSRKTEFANHVLQHGTSQYFTNFQDLHDIVSEILEPPEKA